MVVTLQTERPNCQLTEELGKLIIKDHTKDKHQSLHVPYEGRRI